MRKRWERRRLHRELTTLLTTKMTTVGLPDTSTYTTTKLISCLVTPPARAYGSEGWPSASTRCNPFTIRSRRKTHRISCLCSLTSSALMQRNSMWPSPISSNSAKGRIAPTQSWRSWIRRQIVRRRLRQRTAELQKELGGKY
jgi:hypothetical protein